MLFKAYLCYNKQYITAKLTCNYVTFIVANIYGYVIIKNKVIKMLEQIKTSLDSNPNLSDEMRDMIYGLTVVFNKKFPDVKLKNLSEKLKTLKIERISRFAQRRVMEYVPSTNILTFNLDELAKGHDVRHLMMYSLLQIITSNGTNTGFDEEHKYEALNAGYTEILTDFLIGNDSDIQYLAEQVVEANIIGIVVGSDTMKEAYFFNKPSAILNALEEAGVEL